MLSHLLSRDLVAFTLYAQWESETLALLMESNRCGQTMEESPAVVEVIVRPDEPPSSQDITVSSSSYCSSSSALRIAENSQLPALHFVTRTDSADCHMSRVNDYSQSLPMGFIPRVDFRDTHVTSSVNLSPQLPMDNRRESQTAGESTVNTSTAIFRSLNVPAMSAFRSSRASSTLEQSTYPMPRGSAASLPANGVRISTLACCILMSNNLAGYQSFYTHALLFHTQSFCTLLGRFIPSQSSFSIPILIECVFHCYI